MPNLKLSLACGNYDHTRALLDGRVNPEGIDFIFVPLSPREMFWRMLQYNDFDVSEMSLSACLMERCKENARFIAIPIFPSKIFRHSYIFINKRSGINIPQDLKGKRVGIQEYSLTAIVWIKGFLQHDYGVSPADMEWFMGGREGFRLAGRAEMNIPPTVQIHNVPKEKSLGDMLANGEIDALIDPVVPSCLQDKHPNVGRLWPNYKEVEMDYYKRTKIFPIMHAVVIKQEVYHAHPWVGQSIYKAFSRAKKLGYDAVSSRGILPYMLPWARAEYESTVSLMGEDFWAYGTEANKVALETFAEYSFEQGLSTRRLSVEEPFAPNTLPIAMYAD